MPKPQSVRVHPTRPCLRGNGPRTGLSGRCSRPGPGGPCTWVPGLCSPCFWTPLHSLGCSPFLQGAGFFGPWFSEEPVSWPTGPQMPSLTLPATSDLRTGPGLPPDRVSPPLSRPLPGSASSLSVWVCLSVSLCASHLPTPGLSVCPSVPPSFLRPSQHRLHAPVPLWVPGSPGCVSVSGL